MEQHDPEAQTENLLNDHTTTHASISERWQKTTHVAWGAFAIFFVGLFIAGLPARFTLLIDLTLEQADALAELGISSGFRAWWLLGLEIILMLGYSLIGFSIFLQKPNEWTTTFVSLLMIAFGTTILNSMNALGETFPSLVSMVTFAKAINWMLLVPVFYIFPDGYFAPRWTRWLTMLWVSWTVAWFIFPALPINPTNPGTIASPVRFPIYLAWFGTGLFAQIYRYRKISSLSQRQQTKWVVFGFTIAVSGTFIGEFPSFLNPLLLEDNATGILYNMASTASFTFFALVVPLTMINSIRRNRLWEIDFLINRSLVYGTVTGLLGIIFIGIIVVLQQFFETLTGGQQSTIAIAASTLAISALFQPIRNILRKAIDHRLYGIQINYQKKPRPNFKGFSLENASLDLGLYEIIAPIRRGGMAEIYRGRHKNLEQDVAIKVLPPKLAAQIDFRKRFEREARTIATLKHPNIVEVFDFGKTGSFHYIVMEFIRGKNLAEVLQESGYLEIPFATALISEVADAIDYAHEKGVIHRDIKPSNVMLRPNENSGSPEIYHPVLTDFGIAKLLTGETQITQTGVIGTFDFIAPEQIQAAGQVDSRADIYSLGVMVYQILTGNLPFTSNNVGATLIAHLQQPPLDPRQLRPELTDQQGRAILKALSKRPGKRFQTASSFSEALR